MTAIEEGRPQEMTPFAGRSAGVVREVLPAAQVVRAISLEAEQALERTAALRRAK
jgi:hypothetical protein